jgi:hypothetical protein
MFLRAYLALHPHARLWFFWGFTGFTSSFRAIEEFSGGAIDNLQFFKGLQKFQRS